MNTDRFGGKGQKSMQSIQGRWDIVISKRKTLSITAQIGILLVGGGGGGWKGCCGARSGHVEYKTFTVTKNHTRVVMTVGRGGYGGHSGESGAGEISEVYIDKDGPDEQYWRVKGGKL